MKDLYKKNYKTLMKEVEEETKIKKLNVDLIKIFQKQPSVVAHAYNPSTLGGWGRYITWAQELKTVLANMVKTHFYKKYKN